MIFLELKPPFDRLWAGRDAFAAATELADTVAPEAVVRNVEGRRTLRFELPGRACYLKLQNGIGWKRIGEDLLRLRRPILGASNEWHAIQAFDRYAIPTMTALACGERGRGPAGRESFLITEAVEPAIDLDSYTRDWRTAPPFPPFKRALIREVAEIARRMHENGLNHRDFYLCHLLLKLDTAPSVESIRLAVIDLHRVQIRRHTPLRWRFKDLAALFFSALEIGLTRRDYFRFLQVYFSDTLRGILKKHKKLLAALEREAARLQVRYARKFAHRPPLQR